MSHERIASAARLPELTAPSMQATKGCFMYSQPWDGRNRCAVIELGQVPESP